MKKYSLIFSTFLCFTVFSYKANAQANCPEIPYKTITQVGQTDHYNVAIGYHRASSGTGSIQISSPTGGSVCWVTTVLDSFFIVNIQATSAASIVVTTHSSNYCNLPCSTGTSLPVSLAKFQAIRISGNKISLTWQTLQEINNRKFEVQRSLDGWDSWQTIGTVLSQAEANGGNSDNVLNYSFDDTNAGKTSVSYRLRQVNIDGKATLSPVRKVSEVGNFHVSVFPNPAQGMVKVTFDNNDSYDVSLLDTNGKTIQNWVKVKKSIEVNTFGLSGGIYLLKVSSDTNTETRQLLVR